MSRKIKNSKNDLEADLEKLRNFIKDHKEFRNFEDIFDDKILLNFLRGKKYDYQKACECLHNFMKIRTSKYADVMRDLRPSENGLWNEKLLRVLRHRDSKGRMIMIDTVRLWDPAVHSAELGLHCFILLADEALKSVAQASDPGVVMIFDFRQYTFHQARSVTPSLLVRGVNLLINNMPIRFKETHIISQGYLISALFKFIKQIISKKLRERIFIHSDVKCLHEFVSPEILPDFLEGHLRNDQAFDEDFHERVLRNDDFYEQFTERISTLRN